jgi:hypothetical protein
MMFEHFRKTATAEEKQTDEIVELLKDSATVVALKSERQARINSDRRAALERLAAAEQESSETLPGLYQQFEAAKQDVEEIETKFREDIAAARGKRDRLDYQYTCAKFRIEQAMSKDQRLLLNTTAPALDEFWRWLWAEDEKARHAVAVRLGIKVNLAGASRMIRSNVTPIEQRRVVIRAAMDRVEAMKFEVIEDLMTEIAALKASIPPDRYPDKNIEVLLPRPRDETPRYTDNAKDERPAILKPEISWW